MFGCVVLTPNSSQTQCSSNGGGRRGRSNSDPDGAPSVAWGRIGELAQGR